MTRRFRRHEVRKYFQINHMVALLGPALRELRALPSIRLLDAGCGRSYLTLLLAWCARHVWRQPLEVIGIDRDPARDRGGAPPRPSLPSSMMSCASRSATSRPRGRAM